MHRQWHQLIPIAFCLGSILTPIAAQAVSKPRFVCLPKIDPISQRPVPTTFAWQMRGKTAIIRWEKALGGRSPEKRCQEVSINFQQAYDSGTLKHFTNTYKNNHPVICASSKADGRCETLIMTLDSNEDSRKILNIIQDIFSDSYPVGPIRMTNQAIVRIDIDEFLRNAPVE